MTSEDVLNLMDLIRQCTYMLLFALGVNAGVRM
jgi:hypothetical protein